MNRRKRWIESNNIRRRYLKYTLSVLTVLMLLTIIVISVFMRQSIDENVVEKYMFVNEKMSIALDSLFLKSDEAMEECIIMDNIQKSLNNQSLSVAEKTALSKQLAYVGLDEVENYLYIDNKKNTYTKSYYHIAYEDFQKGGFSKLLQGDYSKTRWVWQKDTVFMSEKTGLFILRYMRNMNYSHEPGIMVFKMKNDFLGEVLAEVQKESKDVITGILDENGILCLSNIDGKDENKQRKYQNIAKKIQARLSKASDGEIKNEHLEGGVVFASKQKDTGFIVFTHVPNEVFLEAIMRVLGLLLFIYVGMVMFVIFLSIYFAKRFTKPIQEISTAMTQFDGTDFTKTKFTRTNTELDQIGDVYNELLERLENQLIEMKKQERELRKSELNTLINQINPHFLYNTLDTIYMLARIHKEPTTMKMIQALSKYLRVTLSKGSDVISVDDEIDNARNYMEIQKIRNQNLFEYEVLSEVEGNQVGVLKMILQPLVENAIKYGFCELFEGGIIKIWVGWQEEFLVFHVYNNGKPIEKNMADKICSLNEVEVTKMKDVVESKEHGYGIRNIMTRLRLKYGEEARLLCEPVLDGTLFTIKIPGSGLEYYEK